MAVFIFMRPFFLQIFLLFITFLSSSGAQALPGDNNYFILDEGPHRVIFDKQYEDSISILRHKIKSRFLYNLNIRKQPLLEPLTVILLSDRTQITNAGATIIPSSTIIMFPSAVGALNWKSGDLWFDTTFEHELSHIFQLSHSDHFLRRKMKLPIVIFPFYIIHIYPNLLLAPRFAMEGDSILKESSIGKGGRLFSGAARAFVYASINHYKNSPRLFAKYHLKYATDTPHAGKNIYLHGAYIMAMLAEKYSPEIINAFFKIKPTPPYRVIQKIKNAALNKKLGPLFGKYFSFNHYNFFLDDLAKLHFHKWGPEAALQKSSPKKAFLNHFTCPPFNSIDEDVAFLTSDLKSPPKLFLINKKTKKITSKKISLPLGKVFKIDGQFHSRASRKTAPYITRYSLFSKGYLSQKNYESKYIQDIKNGKTLYIDSKNNLTGFKLYLDENFYDKVDSNALFDHRGNIYYFKQKNKIKVLHRNKKPVFSFRGFDAALVEIDKKGAVYFTSSTKYGSSIFKYENGVISRSSSSDTIIQGRLLNRREFLVCEVTAKDYAYKIIPIENIKEKPTLYKYHFKKNKKSKILLTQNSLSKLSSKTGDEPYKKYSPLSEMHYRGAGLSFATLGKASAALAAWTFMDDLGKNSLITSLSGFQYIMLPDESLLNWIFVHSTNLGFVFTHAGYNPIIRLSYGASLNPDMEFDLSSDKKEEQGLYFQDRLSHLANIYLHYLITEKGRWSSYLALHQGAGYSHFLKRRVLKSRIKVPEDDISSSIKNQLSEMLEKKEKKTDPAPLELRSRAFLNVSYAEHFSRNYSPYKSFNLNSFLDYRNLIKNKKRFQKGLKAGGSLHSSFYLGGDFYLYPHAAYQYSFHPYANPVTALIRPGMEFYKALLTTLLPEPSRFHREPYSHSYISENFIRGEFPIFPLWALPGQSLVEGGLGFRKIYYTAHRSRFVAPLMRGRFLAFNILDLDDDKDISKKQDLSVDHLLKEAADPLKVPSYADAKIDEEDLSRKGFKKRYFLELLAGVEFNFHLYPILPIRLGLGAGVTVEFDDLKKLKIKKGGILSSTDSSLKFIQFYLKSKF